MPRPSAETTVPNISSREFWSQPAAERAATFAELRRSAPVSFQEPATFDLMRGRGYWAVTRHADVQRIGRSPELFCSGQGVGLADIPVELLELNASFLVMDAPRHTKLRRIVSGAFTPRRVAQLEEAIAAEATRIVDELVERGGGDVVEHLSKASSGCRSRSPRADEDEPAPSPNEPAPFEGVRRYAGLHDVARIVSRSRQGG